MGGLPLPHTPQIYEGQLYLLLSGTGELVCVDVDKGTYEVIVNISGFARGMAKCEDYLFIGYSKRRTESSSAGKLRISKRADQAGIVVVHLPSGKIVGEINQAFFKNVTDIYTIHLLKERKATKILDINEFNYLHHPYLKR